MKRRVLSIALVLLMAFALLPFGALAADEQEGCLTYKIENGEAIVTGLYTAPEGGRLVIPETLGGAPVREIGARAFMNSNLITEVVLPEGLEMIGGAAFAHIKALKTITLPDSLLILNTECFIDTGLTGIVIPPHVRFIGGSAFSGCQALRSLSFAGNELKTIEAYAFFDTHLQMETLKIPNSVTSVGIYAFTSGGFKTLILSSGMTEIPQGCFIGGTWLQTLRIPASIKSIGEYAFDGKLGEQITQVYFDGTESEWAQVSIGDFNDQLRTMKVHCKAEPYVDPFLDVLEKEYYAEPVRWAVSHTPQITNGTGANTFSPEATCTRGQVVTFLWRAMGCPEPTSTNNPFVDVHASDYFYKPVLWAVEQGITNGMDKTHFDPEGACTRAHVVTFLWRAHNKPAAGTVNPFSDVPANEYYTDAVLWAVKNGITNGMDAKHFGPDSPCIRGQIVTFLYRDLAK